MASATGSKKTKHGDDNGGERAAAIYTLIETCKIDDVDPRAGLTKVLARLPDWTPKTTSPAPGSAVLRRSHARTGYHGSDIGHPAWRFVFHKENKAPTQLDQLALTVFGRCVVGRIDRWIRLYRCRTVIRDPEELDTGIARPLIVEHHEFRYRRVL